MKGVGVAVLPEDDVVIVVGTVFDETVRLANDTDGITAFGGAALSLAHVIIVLPPNAFLNANCLFPAIRFDIEIVFEVEFVTTE